VGRSGTLKLIEDLKGVCSKERSAKLGTACVLLRTVFDPSYCCRQVTPPLDLPQWSEFFIAKSPFYVEMHPLKRGMKNMRNLKAATLGLLALTTYATFGGSASAADLGVRPLYRPVAVAGFSWTGFYIGGNIGAGWGTKEFEQTIPLSGIGAALGSPVALPTLVSDGSHTVNGFLGGGQVGYNYQWGPTVWGVEFQGEGADLKGKGNCGLVALFNCSSKVDGILTVAGRFGLTWDHTLIYVKGGGAWAHDKYDVNLLGLSFAFPGIVSIQPASTSEWRSGWMIGTGVEQSIFGNWSAKIEYNYMDFGTHDYLFRTVSVPAAPVINGVLDRFDVTQRIHLIKFGVNYRFGYFGH
jgi:outer membrane immunogenic protein